MLALELRFEFMLSGSRTMKIIKEKLVYTAPKPFFSNIYSIL